jgi:tetratricopeptide (TPR) repeat protein
LEARKNVGYCCSRTAIDAGRGEDIVNLPENDNHQNTYALVVAIEKYTGIPSLPGLVKDAIKFVDWLLNRQVPPENIFLFLSPIDQNSQNQLVQELKRKHNDVQLEIQIAEKDKIKDTIGKKIQQPISEGRDLYVFWSGHGFTTGSNSTRCLFCSDATEDSPNNLNISSLLNALNHSRGLHGFSHQIYYIDACAVNYTFGNSNGEGGWKQSKIDQIKASQILFAAPPDSHCGSENQHYALFAASVGNAAIVNSEISFSKAVLAAIKDQPLIPKMSTVKDAVINWLKEKLQDGPSACSKVALKCSWESDIQEYSQIYYSSPLNLMGDLILPNDPNRIRGRDLEFKKLKDLISTPNKNIIGIAGLPGVGKSTLAGYFVKQQGHLFQDGVIGLRVDDKDQKTIARLVAEHCQKPVSRDSNKGITEIMRDSLQDKELLLIFDNADRAQDVSKIRELCRGIDRCHVIITSRDRNIFSDAEIRVNDLIELKILSPEAALEILKSDIGEQRVQNELDVANKIIELLGCLPLALKLAGKTLEEPTETYPDLKTYAQELSDARKNLQLPEALAPADLTEKDAENSIRCSFNLSFKKITPEPLKEFFSCLSICAGSFGWDEAQAVSENIEKKNLDDLCKLSLLTRSGSQSPFQYEFHPLIRQFAFEKLRENSHLQRSTEQRYADYFIDLVEQSRSDKILQHLEGLIQVAQWMNRQQQPTYNFARRLIDLFDKHGKWNYAVQFFAEFYQLAIELKDWEEAIEFGIQQAKFLRQAGKWSKALALIETLETHLKNVINPDVQLFNRAQLLVEEGGNLQRMSQLTQALKVFTESLSIGRTLYKKDASPKHLRHLAITLNSRGDCHKQKEELSKAIEDFKASLTEGKNLVEMELKLPSSYKKKGQKHIGMVLNSLGMAYVKLADSCCKDIGKHQENSRSPYQKKTKNKYQETLEQARNYFKESLVIREKLNDPRSQAITLDGLGQCYQKQKLYPEAKEAFDRSINIDKVGNPRGEATARTNRSSLLCETTDFQLALNDLEEAEKLLLSIKDYTGLAKVYNRRSQVYKSMMQEPTAEDSVEQLQKQEIESLLKSIEMNTKLKEPDKGLRLMMPKFINLLKKLDRPTALNYCNNAIETIKACQQIKDSSYLEDLFTLQSSLQTKVD